MEPLSQPGIRMSLTPSLMERERARNISVIQITEGKNGIAPPTKNNSRLPRMICAQSGVPFVLLNAGSVSSKHSHEKEKTNVPYSLFAAV